MNEDLSALERALRKGHWREANEATRLLCEATIPALEQLRNIDNQWQHYSGGRFGFTIQCQIWKDLGGPDFAENYDSWSFFARFGDEIGWRRDGLWLGLAGASGLHEGFQPLDVRQEAILLVEGCLPFHDVMSSGNWLNEFSPRDCWGEFVWNRWVGVLGTFQ